MLKKVLFLLLIRYFSNINSLKISSFHYCQLYVINRLYVTISTRVCLVQTEHKHHKLHLHAAWENGSSYISLDLPLSQHIFSHRQKKECLNFVWLLCTWLSYPTPSQSTSPSYLQYQLDQWKFTNFVQTMTHYGS